MITPERLDALTESVQTAPLADGDVRAVLLGILNACRKSLDTLHRLRDAMEAMEEGIRDLEDYLETDREKGAAG